MKKKVAAWNEGDKFNQPFAAKKILK